MNCMTNDWNQSSLLLIDISGLFTKYKNGNYRFLVPNLNIWKFTCWSNDKNLKQLINIKNDMKMTLRKPKKMKGQGVLLRKLKKYDSKMIWSNELTGYFISMHCICFLRLCNIPYVLREKTFSQLWADPSSLKLLVFKENCINKPENTAQNPSGVTLNQTAPRVLINSPLGIYSCLIESYVNTSNFPVNGTNVFSKIHVHV